MTKERPQSWHLAKWPLLAWLETTIKLIAFIVALIALKQTLNHGDYATPQGLGLVQVSIQVILSLGLVVAIFDRWIEREVVSMLFVIPNNVTHWGIVLVLFSTGNTKPLNYGTLWLIAFFSLMLLGDLVKLCFLKRHNFSVRDTPPALLYGLTLVYVLGYGINLVVQITRWS